MISTLVSAAKALSSGAKGIKKGFDAYDKKTENMDRELVKQGKLLGSQKLRANNFRKKQANALAKKQHQADLLKQKQGIMAAKKLEATQNKNAKDFTKQVNQGKIMGKLFGGNISTGMPKVSPINKVGKVPVGKPFGKHTTYVNLDNRPSNKPVGVGPVNLENKIKNKMGLL